jgi:hypothetical protein
MVDGGLAMEFNPQAGGMPGGSFTKERAAISQHPGVGPNLPGFRKKERRAEFHWLQPPLSCRGLIAAGIFLNFANGSLW